MVLVSGFAGHLVFAPAHPWGLLASQLRPRGLPVRPPRGLPQNRAFVWLCCEIGCIGQGRQRLQALRPASQRDRWLAFALLFTMLLIASCAYPIGARGINGI